MEASRYPCLMRWRTLRCRVAEPRLRTDQVSSTTCDLRHVTILPSPAWINNRQKVIIPRGGGAPERPLRSIVVPNNATCCRPGKAIELH